MIETILPASVCSAEAYTDVGEDDLFPEEHAVVANAVARRRAEFATVRRCARTALSALGVERAPLLPDESRAPRWPDGIVGSMTHTTGYRGAAVARRSDVLTIGIDAEPDQPLPDGVLDTIASPRDRAGLARFSPGPAVAWDRLLFSAKESVYKAWFPVTRRWLDFEDVAVTLHPEGTFAAFLLVDGPQVDGRLISGFSGRWTSADGIVATAIVVPAG